LEKVFKNFKNKFHEETKISFYRHKKNLGVYWNLMFAFDKCHGSYVIFMQHDDWLIDKNFLSDAIKKLDGDNEIKLVVGNSEQEFSKQKSMSIETNKWIEINGSEYISKHLFFDMHPIFSTVIYRMSALKNNNYKDFFVESKKAHEMGVEIDECFVGLVLAASAGKVVITGKVVCVQGKPITAATNLNLHLLKKKGMDVGMFIPYYKLYNFFIINKNFNCAQEMKRLMVKQFCVRHINLKVLSFLKWDFNAILFMTMSFSFRVLRWLKKINIRQLFINKL